MHHATSATGGDDASWLVFNRRELFTIVGASIMVAACGGKSRQAAPITARSAATGTSAIATQAAGSPAGAGSGSAGGARPTAAGGVVKLGGPHATGSDAMSLSDAQREAQIANGHWLGSWHDEMGRSGDSDVVIAIDAPNRTATASVSFSGDLFGAPIPAVTYDIDLLSFMLSADSYNVMSPQFGQVNLSPGGSGSAAATSTAVPGQPTIDHIEVSGSLVAKRADATYTVHYVDGHAVKGTMAWTAGGSRATPAALGAPGSTTPAEVQSGAYAASLLTASQLTTVFGEPFGAPQSNGGKLFFASGIDASDGTVTSTSGSYNVQYTVYLGHDMPSTAAFWQQEGAAGKPPIPGPWIAAFYYDEISTLYVELATRVLQIQVVFLKATSAATPQQAAMAKAFAVQVGTAMANNIKAG